MFGKAEQEGQRGKNLEKIQKPNQNGEEGHEGGWKEIVLFKERVEKKKIQRVEEQGKEIYKESNQP